MHQPSNEWNLKQWLYHLEHRNSQEIQLGLTRIRQVAYKLDVLNPDYKIITVGGTNGKGSTVCALEKIYHEAGYQVGSYTSPHLLCFNDRIKINLIAINDKNLCAFFGLIEETRGDINLTYFEFVTLAALLYFKKAKLDIVILEVGLGGRLDATNILDADLAIITTIDYDHQEYLGTSLEAIGYEKAGILRKSRPLIFADKNPPASIIQVAQELSVPCYVYGKEFSFQEEDTSFDIIFLQKKIKKLVKPKLQLKSAVAAVIACLLLDNALPVAPNYFSQAFNQLFLHGRLQLIPGTINILYDVSHNPQAVLSLAEYIKALPGLGQVHAIFAALRDKDILGLINPLKDRVDVWYPAQLDSRRALDANSLLTLCGEAKIKVACCYKSPLIAFNAALHLAKTGDLIVVYGSFLTVSAVMANQNNLLEQKEII